MQTSCFIIQDNFNWLLLYFVILTFCACIEFSSITFFSLSICHNMFSVVFVCFFLFICSCVVSKSQGTANETLIRFMTPFDKCDALEGEKTKQQNHCIYTYIINVCKTMCSIIYNFEADVRFFGAERFCHIYELWVIDIIKHKISANAPEN